MDSTQLQRLLRISGTIAAFSLLIYLLSQQGWGEILQGLQAIPIWRFAAAIGLMILSRLSVASRWTSLLRSAGVPVRAREGLRITFAGLFASNFLPTTIGGDVVRLALSLQQGYDKVLATASLVVDRLVGMAGMATCAPLGLVPLFGPSGDPEFVFSGVVSGFAERLGDIFRRLRGALGLWLRSPRGLLLAYGWTWVHQLCIFGVVWLMLGGMGERIPFWLTGGLWSFTYFVTLLPVSINGLGLQELSMTAIFTGLGGVGVTAAATTALLVRTLQMMASLPGVVFLPDILSGRKMAGEGEG